MPGHFNPHALSGRTRQILPRKSGAHRIACLALYRALFEQCLRVPLPDDLSPAGPTNPIKHLIYKLFKRNIPISSPRLAVDALKVGYAAEKLLRAAGDGNAPALSKVHALLRLKQERSEHSRHVCQPPPPREPPPRVGPYPGAPKLLDIRPLPLKQLSGLRRVPHLTQTNGYPFLRTRKPQSAYLSRIFRDKIKQKDKRFRALAIFEREVDDGEDEAIWEDIVMEQLQKEGGGNKKWLKGEGADWGKDDDSWVAESTKAKMKVKQYLWEDVVRTKELGERMTNIYEAEKQLWRQERAKRKYEKNLARKERKRLKGEAGTTQVEGVVNWKPEFQ